jgi:dTDP-4-dehydrorhamnose reductase
VSGLSHLGAGGETSWHGYACFVLNLARQAGMELKAAAESVIPVPTSAFPLPARRPLNSRLDTRKLQTAFGLHLPLWQIGVARMLSEILEKRP